jgi:hypothetical protein
LNGRGYAAPAFESWQAELARWKSCKGKAMAACRKAKRMSFSYARPRQNQSSEGAMMIAIVGAGITFSANAQAQEIKRTDLTQGDLTGTNMAIVAGITEFPPGAWSRCWRVAS